MTTKTKRIRTLYAHPEAMGKLTFDVEMCRLFAFNESEALSAHVSIGPVELRNLAFRLLSLSDEVSALHFPEQPDAGGCPF